MEMPCHAPKALTMRLGHGFFLSHMRLPSKNAGHNRLFLLLFWVANYHNKSSFVLGIQ